MGFLHRFAGEDIEVPDDGVQGDDTLTAAVDSYRQTWARVDAVVATADLEESCRHPDDAAPVNLRWVLMHLLEETARHAGHADILRELIDGNTGRRVPPAHRSGPPSSQQPPPNGFHPKDRG